LTAPARPNHRGRNSRRRGFRSASTSELEQQLIGALCQNLSDQVFKQELLASFEQCLAEAVDREVKFVQEAGTKNAELKLERTNLVKQIYNLTDAIAQLGISPALSARLSGAESRLQQIEHMLSSPQKSLAVTFTKEEIEGFLDQNCKSLTSILLGDAAVARQELQKRIAKLVLTPKAMSNGPVFEVSGDVALFTGKDDVMVTKSLEGIAQHYTLPRIALANVVLDPTLPVAA
jgi:hypothetical protein